MKLPPRRQQFGNEWIHPLFGRLQAKLATCHIKAWFQYLTWLPQAGYCEAPLCTVNIILDTLEQQAKRYGDHISP